MIAQDGSVIAINGKTVTQATYDALSSSLKSDATLYAISDSTDITYQKLSAAKALLGTTSKLTQCGYTDVCSAILDLYNRLGGIYMSIDANTNSIQAVYNDDATAGSTASLDINSYATEEEQVDALVAIVGDKADLTETGNTTVIGAIADIYTKLNGLAFSYNIDLNTLVAMYDDGT